MDDIWNIVDEAIRQADATKRAYDEWQVTQEAMQPVPEMVTKSVEDLMVYKTRNDARVRTPEPATATASALTPYEVLADECARFCVQLEKRLEQKVDAAIGDLERRYFEAERKMMGHRISELEQQLKAKSVLLR